jgi:hypothetical protein
MRAAMRARRSRDCLSLSRSWLHGFLLWDCVGRRVVRVWVRVCAYARAACRDHSLLQLAAQAPHALSAPSLEAAGVAAAQECAATSRSGRLQPPLRRGWSRAQAGKLLGHAVLPWGQRLPQVI